MEKLAEIIPKIKHSARSYDDYLKAKVNLYNSTPGKYTGYNCKKCLNRGYIAEIRDGVEIMVRCECLKKREALKRLQESGISNLIKTKTFTSFETVEPYQMQIKETAAEFLNNYKNNWYFIGGQNGCGKTHICIAISGQLLKLGEAVRYMLWLEEAPILKAKVNESDYKELISVYQKADVLYIDDLFKGGASEADIRLAFQIIDYRYRNSMCTIISSEHMLNELYKIDRAIGGRIREKAIKINIQKDEKKDYRLKM